MPDTKATVFISYRRRISWATAQLVSSDLIRSGFDVYMDVENVHSGEFETMILTQISSRDHFILVLEPGSLEGIDNADDWLRREIYHALACRRNIVPVAANGFSLASLTMLPPGIAKISRLNALSIPTGYVQEALQRLRDRFLRASEISDRGATPSDEGDQTDEKANSTELGYKNLERLLQAGRWREADTSTEELMRAMAGRPYGEHLSNDDLYTYPCDSLIRLDNLWARFSEGRFGFSPQMEIWRTIGGLGSEPEGDDELERRFGDQVGWRINDRWLRYTDYNFSLAAPVGAENRVTLCDLQVLVDEAAEPVSPEHADGRTGS
jgi:GUN4-like/TIR domain